MGLLIGLDPGTQTGLAVWDTKSRTLTRVVTLRLYQAFEVIRHEYREADGDIEIFFEDARQRKWIPRERNLSEYRGRLMGAGSVKRDCEIWEEFCVGYGIRFHAIPPRKGATKWDADYFKKVTGWTGRTSNHARDAALLVFGK